MSRAARWMGRFGAWAMLLISCGCRPMGAEVPVIATVAGTTVELRYQADPDAPNRGECVVDGLTTEQLQLLRDPVRAAQHFQLSIDGRTPLPGHYRVDAGQLRFRPLFPLAFDLDHQAKFDFESLPLPHTEPLQRTIRIPAPQREPTSLTAIYPSGTSIPENVLRFYLHFSAPMRQGEVYQRVRLLDARGEPIDLPFLEIDEELWDVSSTRLTLLIDPGRIKRGLKPREDVGPVLEAGKRYTLEVDAAWRDAYGRPLRQGMRREFHVGPPLDTPIDPQLWKIRAPQQSDQPLEVHFDRPLDRALLEHELTVRSSTGVQIPGQIEVAEHERLWRFRPLAPWSPEEYRLHLGESLEDVAGNRLDRAFDTDLSRSPPPRAVSRQWPFRVP